MSARSVKLAAAALALALALATVAVAADGTTEREIDAHDARPVVEFSTTHGTFAIELRADVAPKHVERFSNLADADAERGYAGSAVCEVRARTQLVFGCRPAEREKSEPRALGVAPLLAPEIDASALGLEERPVGEGGALEYLLQQELLPRHRELRARGDEVPPSLESFVEALREGSLPLGPAAFEGRSRRWYLEALGFRYEVGLSGLPVDRWSVATFSRSPDGSDARFLVALDRISERDGRSTVFGRVVDGRDTLRRIADVRVGKGRFPLETVRILSVRVHDASARGERAAAE